jgi:hypothetical protein
LRAFWLEASLECYFSIYLMVQKKFNSLVSPYFFLHIKKGKTKALPFISYYRFKLFSCFIS